MITELEFIKNNYPTQGAKFCATALGITPRKVYSLTEKHGIKRIEANPPGITPVDKVCYSCQERLPLESFNKCRTGIYGLHNHCRSCQKEIKRQWYLKNQENELIKAKEYSKSDKAKAARQERWIKEKEKLKPKNNARRKTEKAKEKARSQRNEWNKIPQNRIATNLRVRLRHALKDIHKSAVTEELLGCSFLELKVHLESLFLPEMTWENYGQFGWHIDHIKPCASFDLTDPEQQKACCHFTNLQPLWWRDNLSKGDRLL